MEYIMICDNEPIGKIVEPVADYSMGVVQGPLIPLSAYERVRPVFRLFTETKISDDEQGKEERFERYYEAFDKLHLSVTTTDGRPVPIISAHVEDYSVELEDDGYEGFFVVESAPLFEPSGSFFDDPRFWDGPHSRFT